MFLFSRSLRKPCNGACQKELRIVWFAVAKALVAEPAMA
jgi:hypothetical protein